MLQQVVVALYADGDQDLGLGFGGRYVERDAVEVRDDLVD